MTERDINRTEATEFPPHVLREYSFIADGERGAVIGPRGDIAWMCAPHWHSDAVFSTLIGGGGVYAVTPRDPRFVWGGYYEDGSLIWRSRWTTSDHIVECREAMAFPGDRRTAVVLRRIMAVDGDAHVRVILDPRAGFGRHRMSHVAQDGNVWTFRCGSLWMRWSGASEHAHRKDRVLQLDLDVPGGGYQDLVLEISDRPLDDDPVDAKRAWEITTHSWADVVPDLSDTISPVDSAHAYAIVRGMTSPGGGMVAAATTSLPERAERDRNYDYRYSWLRDQSYAGQAIATCGPCELLDDAVQFVAARILEDGPEAKPAYCSDGTAVPSEQTLDLVGYPGGSDKIGNWVNDQFQLDVFGEALLLFGAASRHDRLNLEQWKAVETTVAAIEKRRYDPDAGIWEVDPAHWAHSRLICVAGLRSIAEEAPGNQGTKWSVLADSLLVDASGDCLHPSGRWQRAPDDERIDASLLLPAIRGGVPADDPRTVATLDAVLHELGRDGFVYRFRQDQRPLGEAEGAFLLCGFLAALAVHQQGDELGALRLFERNRSACGSPGLFAEEFDVGERQLRGNLPQAFVHATLLEASQRLAEPPDTRATRCGTSPSRGVQL